MSFRDLGSKGASAKQQAKARRSSDEESSFERSIKANIQELQDTVRRASEKLEQAQRSFLSRRMGESLDDFLEKSRSLSQQTEQLFRDWTIQMAGEPGERHKKKFSFEKLQKAFEEEVVHLKEVAQQRAALEKQEAQSSQGQAAHCEDQCSSEVDDAEQGLLANFDNREDERLMAHQEDLSIRNRIVQERDEGIRRIQNQVTEVNQIIRDLASIVHDQGEQVRGLEDEAASSSTNTKEAVQELKKAVDRQRGSREKLCCMLAAAVVVLCFVILPQTHVLEFHHTALNEGGGAIAENWGNSGSLGAGAVSEHALTAWQAEPGTSEVSGPAASLEPRLVSKAGRSLT